MDTVALRCHPPTSAGVDGPAAEPCALVVRAWVEVPASEPPLPLCEPFGRVALTDSGQIDPRRTRLVALDGGVTLARVASRDRASCLLVDGRWECRGEARWSSTPRTPRAPPRSARTPSGLASTSPPDPEPGDRVIGHDDTDLAAIPEAAITAARQTLHVAHEHTSHGSQLITGMNSLASFPDYGARYAGSDSGEGDALELDDEGIPADVDDLSVGDGEDAKGDTPWVVGTRALLDDPAHAHVNVVMWSWSIIDGHDARRYVDNMEQLIREYPSVTFVIMTGHAEGIGEYLTENGGTQDNELIRAHCRAHDRWLFDFADIEAYDPDDTYCWDAGLYDNLDYDGGNWVALAAARRERAASPRRPAAGCSPTHVTPGGGARGRARSRRPRRSRSRRRRAAPDRAGSPGGARGATS